MTKIIIAETSPSMQAIYTLTFQKLEFNLLYVNNCQEIIDNLSIFKPDCLFISQALLDEEELETIENLNSQNKSLNIPIILMAGSFDRIDKNQLKSLEYNSIEYFPFVSRDLRKKYFGLKKIMNLPQSLPEEPLLEESGSAQLDKDSLFTMRQIIKEEIQKYKNNHSNHEEEKS